MSLRLIIAFALSFVLHGSLLLSNARDRSSPPPPPALQATLRLPQDLVSIPEPPPAPDELLKNTLDEEKPVPEKPEPPPPPPPSPPKPAQAGRAEAKRETRAAQRKLSEHVFYPAEAIARGLEGEVRLIVLLAADGRVEEVHIAASSGHPILDNAAIKAAYAMGRLPGATSRELILPVVFQLQ